MQNPPTPEQFKERFPQFDDAEDDLVQVLINEASSLVDDGWLQSDQMSAVMYLAAHWLALESQAAEGGAGSGATGDVASESLGPISITYATQDSSSVSSGGATTFERTYYGQRYLAYRDTNFPAIMVV